MSKSTVFLSKEELLYTKCYQCKNYLSVPPISLQSNGPICGRCEKDPLERAKFFENVAQLMFFPCKNDVYGCDAKLAFGKVFQHEKYCKITLTDCIDFDCNIKLRNSVGDVTSHITAAHQHLLLPEPRVQFYDCGNVVQKINKLFIKDNQGFVIKFLFSNELCYINVESLSNEDTLKICKVKVTDAEDIIYFDEDLKITQYKSKHHDIQAMRLVDGTDFTSYNLFINFEICHAKPEPITDNPLNEQFLSTLECPVCFNYMKPPIYLCQLGHSLCNKCIPNLKKCPFCQSNVSRGRNYSLEQIALNAVYPCNNKFSGCFFTGRLNEINTHELGCNLQQQKCYFTSCKWKGREMLSHFKHSHNKSFIDITKEVKCIFDKQKDFWFIYDMDLYKLKLNFSSKHAVFTVDKFVKTKSKIFRFHLEIISQKGIIKLSTNCSKATKTLSVSQEQLKQVMVNNTFAVKLYITKS